MARYRPRTGQPQRAREDLSVVIGLALTGEQQRDGDRMDLTARRHPYLVSPVPLADPTTDSVSHYQPRFHHV